MTVMNKSLIVKDGGIFYSSLRLNIYLCGAKRRVRLFKLAKYKYFSKIK